MNYLLDNSVFEEKYVFGFFNQISSEQSIEKFIMDKSFIDQAHNGELNEKTLLFRSYLKLLKKIADIEVIETSNFKLLEPVKDFLNTHKETVLVTQRESIAKVFQMHFHKQLEKLCYLENNLLRFWKLAEINLNAFYVEKNKYMFGAVDPSNIDYVFSPKYGFLKLDSVPVHEGGEGQIFKTYQNFVAKIYAPKHQTYQNYKKLEKMVNTSINNRFIIWPKDLIYHNELFVGYIMNHIADTPSMDELRDDAFKEYTVQESLDIILHFLSNIKYLHDRNILVGDMKFDNILVKSAKEVYIIDTGSFQVEDYPCVVYNPEFSDTKLSEDELKKQLRTVESEYYPIHKIIFEILFRKSPYYDLDNIEIGAEEIRKFNYQLKPTVPPENMPSHVKRWFQVPGKIRENFYYYFKDRKITYISEWIQDFKNFKEGLEGREKQ
jgi:serine/threonine protein kinase